MLLNRHITSRSLFSQLLEEKDYFSQLAIQSKGLLYHKQTTHFTAPLLGNAFQIYNQKYSHSKFIFALDSRE